MGILGHDKIISYYRLQLKFWKTSSWEDPFIWVDFIVYSFFHLFIPFLLSGT